MVRCSSCELLLDRYVEGTLSRRDMSAISKHLQTCDDCRALLEELKVVDGLLFTTQALGLPPNFTFAVMSEARTLPVPKAPPTRVWSFLALYIASAWVLFVIALASTGTNVRTVADFVVTSGARMTNAVTMLFSSAHAAGNSTVLFAFGTVALALDAVIAGAAIYFFIAVRPRLAARYVPISEEAP